MSVVAAAQNRSQSATRSPFREYWKRRWESIEPAANALIEDGMLLLIFLAVLTIAYLGLGGLAGLGYDPNRIE